MKLARTSIALLALLCGCQASVNNSAPELAPRHESTALTDALIGKSCRVSLRRDALGMSAPGFAEPMTPMIGGKPALLTGTVDKLTDNWLVLRGETKTYWIPVNAILMVETDSK